MEVVVKKKTDRELVLQVKGEGHTLGNLLAKEAMNNPHVVFASYRVPHPLQDVMELIIEVEEGYPIDKAVIEVVEDLRAKIIEFRRAIEERL